MKYVLKADDIRQAALDRAHPLNPEAKRRTTSLGDLTGLTKVGLHMTVIAPGDVSTELHRHSLADEFMYILSGSAELHLGDDVHRIEAGDFIGLPAMGPAHALKNTGSVDLIYLVGGDRPQFDVCHYPRLDKRLYLYHEGANRKVEYVRNQDVAAK